MELRNRSRPLPPQDGADAAPAAPAAKAHRSPVNLGSLFVFLLTFRLLNALITRTFFQPDEHYQTTEIAHRLVFGYGFKSWEWSSSSDVAPAPANASYLTAAARNLVNGPVRSILHPLLFVPGYMLLKITSLDQTYLRILFPRLQQAVFAAVGDFYTFRLAHRIGGSTVAWLATLVGLSNLYSLYTATRTFSNSTEAAITAAALFYWPYVPFYSQRFDVFAFSTREERAKLLALQGPSCVWQQMAPKDRKEQWDEQSQEDREFDQKQVSRMIYDRVLKKSLLLAALACLLRPTNGVLWMYLVGELLVRQLRCLKPNSNRESTATAQNKQSKIDEQAETQEGSLLPMLEVIGESGSLVRTVATVGFSALGLGLAVDTVYDHLANQAPHGRRGAILPALSLVSFLHKNVVANLSIFYGANPWHWYLTQGVPVLCTVWLPATLFGLVDALQHRGVGNGVLALGVDARRSLAKLVCVTVAVYSLLGHKEFRFLQPLLPALTIHAASGLAASYADTPRIKAVFEQPASPLKQLWRSINLLPLWLRTILLTLQPIAAIYLNTIHSVAQEQVPAELCRIYRKQQLNPSLIEAEEFGPGFGRIHNFGFLMPCHSTPWATHLHDRTLVEKSWFIQCPPPPARSEMTLAQRKVEYWDQSDFFYHDPIKYLVDRFAYNVDTEYPPAPPAALEYGDNPWDKGWRHSWPSHLVVFESLLKEGSRKAGHTRTLKNLLSLKGYREVARYWNSAMHEDKRREGDVVVLAYKGPKSHR
ncbi:related to dolichyl-phosphate-mannose-glycolipid alpha-mannosyltransferase [Ustilago trichophora]|uniref:Mannosyltransferase n=1 Tax=Ustilago trichophora TaxID=86804 RepID=A0A5C3E8Z4_9BASI|nr:related to dolichyl-phosphate-mannose-glycolipid alpha-mannosyltransferase [Ustilago trichophora]